MQQNCYWGNIVKYKFCLTKCVSVVRCSRMEYLMLSKWVSEWVNHILISAVSNVVVLGATESLTQNCQIAAGTLVAIVWFMREAADSSFGFMVTVFGWNSTWILWRTVTWWTRGFVCVCRNYVRPENKQRSSECAQIWCHEGCYKSRDKAPCIHNHSIRRKSKDQLYQPAVLPSNPIKQEVACTAELVTLCWRKELCPCQESNPCPIDCNDWARML